MCDSLIPLNVPPSAFDKMPLSIHNADPLFNVGKHELATALRTPRNHPWVADWLFKDNASPFHLTSATLPPEAFDHSLALHIHQDISIPGHCLSAAAAAASASASASAYASASAAAASLKAVVSKNIDILLVPVANLDDITVGYAFLRGMHGSSLSHAAYSQAFDSINPNAHAQDLDLNAKPIFTARFCFHRARSDFLLAVCAMPGHMIGLVSMRSLSSTSRERSFFVVPKADYAANNLPTRVISMQSDIDYQIPVPDDDDDDDDDNDDVGDADDDDQPMPDPPTPSPTPPPPLDDPVQPLPLSPEPPLPLHRVGAVPSPNSSDSLPDVIHDYLLNYMDTNVYDQILASMSPRVSQTLPLDVSLDDILSVPSSNSSNSHPNSNSNSNTSSASMSDPTPTSIPVDFPPIHDDDILVVDDHGDEDSAFQRPPPEHCAAAQKASAAAAAHRAAAERTEHRSDGSWMLRSLSGTPDGVGVPRLPGPNDTSSGSFDMRALRDALSSFEASARGTFFAPKVRKDVMHPQTGELLSRCTGELKAKTNRPDVHTVRLLRRAAAQSYYAKVLSVSPDARLMAHIMSSSATTPFLPASSFVAPVADSFSQAVMQPPSTPASRRKSTPRHSPKPHPLHLSAHTTTPQPPKRKSPAPVHKRVAPAPLAPRPLPLLPLASPRDSPVVLPTIPAGSPPQTAPHSGVSPATNESQPGSDAEKQALRESKLEAKRIKNRLSAARSNQKRRAQLEAQKKELTLLRQRVDELKSKKQLVTAENETLRKKMMVEDRQPSNTASTAKSQA